MLAGRPLPLLESMIFHASDKHRMPTGPFNLPPIIAERNSPRLRCFGLGLPLYRITDIRIPWHQLTHLCLFNAFTSSITPTLNGYLHVLRQCTNIKSFILTVTNYELKRPAPTLELSLIEDLQLHILVDGCRLGSFLDVLVLPKLRQLYIRCAFLSRDPLEQQ
ncbi:hypothetical protein SERLA73DRAFT_176636, partial [Serpula lacrymans var. lacrymans S7.3]